MRSSRRPSRQVVAAAFLFVTLIAWHLDAIAGQLTVTWIDNSPDALGFSIERSTGTTGTFGEIAITGPGVTAYTDLTVANATTYCYRILAFNSTARSDYSNVACGTAAQSFALAVVKIGAGSGTVASAPPGIICGASCSGTFASGTPVTLTATLDAGSIFTGWIGGGCSGTGACTVTLTAATIVTASFDVAPVSLTVSKAGTGSGTVVSVPPGINCGTTCSGSYASGTAVTLTATPATGSTFTSWSGGSCGGTVTCTVTVTATTIVTATFTTQISDTTPPTAPTGLSAAALSSSQIDLSWGASTDNVGVTGYRVERCQGASCTSFGQVATPTGTTFSDTGLIAATTYSYRVRATDAAGNLGAYSPVASATTTLSPPAAGPVAAYAFDETSGPTASDSSGNALTGVLTNGPVFAPGKNGNAVSLDGVNDYVDLGTPPALQITGSMTIGAWINSTAFPVDDAAVVSQRGSGSDGYQLDTTVDTGPRTIGFKLTNSSGASMIRYGATAMPLNQWYHIAGVYDVAAQTMNVYLNGQLDNGPLLGTITASQQNSSLNTTIGRRSGLTGYEFAGKIDDVRIYNRALAQAEIQADMNTPVVPGASDTTPPTSPAGLTATAVSNVQVDLSWSASTDDVGVTGYRVERCQGAGCTSFAQVATSTETTFSDPGLTAATTYSYRVRAVDATGNLSGYSNIASADLPPTTIFSDDFQRPDSPVPGNGWTVPLGSFFIQSGQLRNDAQENRHVAMQESLLMAAGNLIANFTSVNNNDRPSFGLVFGYRDPLNYYAAYRRVGGSSVLRIASVVNGVETVTAQVACANPVRGQAFQVVVSFAADQIVMTAAGKSVSASGVVVSAGTVGLMVDDRGSSHIIDNFAATP